VTIARAALLVARNTLSAIVSRLDAVLAPVEKEQPPMDAEQAREMFQRQARQSRIAGTRPWNYSRPKPLEVPESLRYLEAIHGTRAAFQFLAKRASRIK
jgi:hypothetical protein